MYRLLLVCLGGAVGSGLRYLFGLWTTRALGSGFPLGTLGVNLAGSFLIVLIMRLGLETTPIPADLRLLLTTGLLGGLTTYSAFAYETINFFDTRAVAMGLLYVAITVIGCLLSGGLGLAAARWLA